MCIQKVVVDAQLDVQVPSSDGNAKLNRVAVELIRPVTVQLSRWRVRIYLLTSAPAAVWVLL